MLPPEKSTVTVGIAYLSTYATYLTLTCIAALSIWGTKNPAADLFAFNSAPKTFVKTQLSYLNCTVRQRHSVFFSPVLRTRNLRHLTIITAVVKNYFDFFSPPRSSTRKQRWTEISSNQNLSKSFLNFFLQRFRNLKYEGVLAPKAGLGDHGSASPKAGSTEPSLSGIHITLISLMS